MNNWRIYGDQTVACRLDRSDFPGFLRKKLVIGPGEAAVVVSDGEVKESLGASKIEAGGALDKILSLFRGEPELSIYLIDTGPHDIVIFLGQTTRENEDIKDQVLTQSQDFSSFENVGWCGSEKEIQRSNLSVSRDVDLSEVSILAISSDSEVVQAECRATLRVDPDNLTGLTKLFKGKKALATWDLAAFVRDDLFARILIPEIQKHEASSLRGNRDLQSSLEILVMTKFAEKLVSVGLSIDAFSVSWGLTEDEVSRISTRRAEREESALEFAKKREIAHQMRGQEIQKTRLANLHELKVASTQGDIELEKLLLSGEIDNTLLLKGVKIDEAKIDAQVKEIQFQIDKKEALLRIERVRAEEELRLDIEDREYKQKNAVKLAEMDIEDKEMQSMMNMQIQMAEAKHDREMARLRQETDADFRRQRVEIEQRYEERKIKLDESLARMGMTERLISQGIGAGAADSSVLNTMLKEATEQEYATTSDEKVKSRADAKAKENDLETYKQAEDRERRHQEKMTGLASDMMESSKQTPPNYPINQRFTNVTTFGQTSCRNCDGNVSVDWANCPHCGLSLLPEPQLACPNCNGVVQNDWKACPKCGQSLLAEPQLTCPECNGAMERGWKACPKCGCVLDP